LNQIYNLADKLKKNRRNIEKALEVEDYDTAKQINDQLKRIKAEISQILDNRIE
jgi:protein-arginine kinase activator protein McsA